MEKVDDVDFDMVDPFGDYNIRTVALVTFSEPSAGVEETQEQIFDELLSKYFKIVRSDYGSGWLAVQELMNEFTITRKNK